MQVYAYLVRFSVKEKKLKTGKKPRYRHAPRKQVIRFLLKLDTLKNRSVVAMIRMSQLFSSRQ